jgi:hypothetical protein
MPSGPFEYIQVGIDSSVRGMLPTQQGTLCHDVRSARASSAFG